MSKKFIKSAKDNSPVIPQRDKYKEDLKIREYPWTENQKRVINTILDKNSKIVFIQGCAGSGKSLLSTYCGLKLLSEKRVTDYIYIRSPLETSDSAGLGFLKGDLDEKFQPYRMILEDKLAELLPPSQVNNLFNDERIQTIPVNYVRGMSWAVKYIVIEECNNFTLSEFKLLLTRYGQFSKMIFVGDFQQTDLPKNKRGAFNKVYGWFNNEDAASKGISCFSLGREDVKRSDITSYIIDKFEKNNDENELPGRNPI